MQVTLSARINGCLWIMWANLLGYEVVGFNAVQEIDGQVSSYLPHQCNDARGDRSGGDLPR